MSGASLELLLSRHPGPHHLPAAQMTPGFRTISFRGVRTVVPPVHGAPISVLASPGVPAPSAAPRGAEPRFAPVFTESLCSVYTQHRHSPAHNSGDAAWALTLTHLDTGGALGKGSQVPGRSAGPQPVGAEPTLCTAPSALDLRFIHWTMSS